MTEPPVGIVALLEMMARESPCAKSKRSAAVFSRAALVCGAGFNGQPAPFACTGTERCRMLCTRICEHAEGRAIRAAAGSVMVRSGRAEIDGGLELAHVKIGDDGKLVAGGPPSCWQCSRAILDCGFVAGVWLYETRPGDFAACQPCSMVREEMAKALAGNPVIGICPHGEPRWTRYSAEEFHRTTLRNCGMLVDAE